MTGTFVYFFVSLEKHDGFILPLSISTVLLCIFLCYYHIQKGLKNAVFAVCLNVFLIAAGFLLFHLHEANHIVYPQYGRDIIVGRVEQKRPLTEERAIIVVKTIKAQNSEREYKASLFLNTDDPEVVPGAIILIRAVFAKVQNKGNPGEYDFASYLKRQHITASGFVESTEVLEVKKDYYHLVWMLKEKLKRLYRDAGFKPENEALLYALTSGDKSLISDEQKLAFQNSGVIHILAVSGLHVGILYMMIFSLLKTVSKTKYGGSLSFLIITVVLVLYAFFTGLSPSVTRAVIMFILIDLTRLLRKPHLIYNVISISAFIIVIADPHYLFEPGFWLSYGAVLSILLFMNLVAPYLREKPVLIKRFFEISLVTLAAQPGTLPLVLLWFKQFPKYFLITNIFIIPFIGIALIYNFVIIILGAIGIPVRFIAKPLDWLITYINLVPEFVSGLNSAVFSGINITFIMVLLLYGLFIAVIMLLYRQNPGLIKHIAVLGIALILLSGFTSYQTEKRREVVLFNSGSTIIADRSGKTCTFYHSNLDEPDQCVEDYVNSTGIQNVNEEHLKKFTYAGEQLFQLVSDRNERMMGLPVQRYLLFETFPKDLISALPYIKQCIILRSCSYYDREKIKDWCKTNTISYHDIREDGAFVIVLTQGTISLPP
ncbi:ComEC/Rec2 family competence protein [Saccharicrinis sp. FJH54]|uniref:ComEC/Rec2 family competence protein n=1 Tax=Saccharicrinis sp. FJH54 TaxID=3344665 RepID=UPI0035D4A5D9